MDSTGRPFAAFVLWTANRFGDAVDVAHAEYIKLLRSVADGKVFDLIPEVATRYASGAPRKRIEIWKPNRQPRMVSAGSMLRIQELKPFILHWTRDEWRSVIETTSKLMPLGLSHVDIEVAPDQTAPIRFTFRWRDPDRWEGRDYLIEIEPAS